MKSKDDKTTDQKQIDWHTGFEGDLKLSFRKYCDVLTIIREFPLSRQIKEDKSMCEALRELMAEELKDAENRGILEGVKEGENNINRLCSILIEQDRIDDLKRATKDPKYQEQLMKELLN